MITLQVRFWSKTLSKVRPGSSGQQLWKNTMAEDDIYTKDGTVDIHRKPANKKKTGNWKACRFILGMVLSYFIRSGFLEIYVKMNPISIC